MSPYRYTFDWGIDEVQKTWRLETISNDILDELSDITTKINLQYGTRSEHEYEQVSVLFQVLHLQYGVSSR